MCKCCCGGTAKKEKEIIYECKKCGKTAKEEKYCCGEIMKARK